MSPVPPRARRSLPVALAAGGLALVLAVGTAGSTAGADGQSARSQRAEVRAQQAQVAAQVDALEGDQAQVEAALASLDENVRGQQALLDDARRQAEASAAQVAQAEADIASTSAEIDELRGEVVAYAVDAYITPPDEDLLRRLEAGSAQEDATKRAMLEMRGARDGSLLDRLKAAQQKLEDERARADAARRSAEEAAAAADQALTGLTTARAQQEDFATQVRARLDDRLADAAYLSRVDADLGRRIAAEEAALAAAVKKVPAGPGPGGGGTSTRPSTKRPNLVTVGGITVNASIGEQVRQLLAAASADGIFLNGYGWRDSSNQVALRGQNCGWTDYALYDMPADQCSPPTARPGSSMHEQGLAIDFMVGNEFIESRTSPAYLWLAANAGRFGLANLPSEPWHWSTTGG